MMKISVIFGTRPEAIKMAMLIKELGACNDIELDVCFTGQHKEMVMPLIGFFEIPVHHSLDIMQHNQSLAGLCARAMDAIDIYLLQVKPDLVFVQGDTTTAMCAASCAFYRKVKVAHVEAGLRTHDINFPFPEEFNRQVISKIASLHFAPTALASQNLLNEQVPANAIFITGNTVIDALLYTQQKIKQQPTLVDGVFTGKLLSKPYILITGHRRENFGEGFKQICLAIKELAEKYPGFKFIYPVHLNPNVQQPVKELLSGLPNIHLLPPQDYVQFASLMANCYLILTDSGGIQEEAPSLGKPVLIMRESTERPEAIQAGVAVLTGTNKVNIVTQVSLLIDDDSTYAYMSKAQNPFGNGNAAKQITSITLKYLNTSEAIGA